MPNRKAKYHRNSFRWAPPDGNSGAACMRLSASDAPLESCSLSLAVPPKPNGQHKVHSMYMVGVKAGAEPARRLARCGGVVVLPSRRLGCVDRPFAVQHEGEGCRDSRGAAQTTNASLRQTSYSWRWGVEGAGVLPWYHSSSIEELQRGDSLRTVKKVSSGSLRTVKDVGLHLPAKKFTKHFGPVKREFFWRNQGAREDGHPSPSLTVDGEGFAVLQRFDWSPRQTSSQLSRV